VHSANGQLPGQFPQGIKRDNIIRHVIRFCEVLGFATIAAMHQATYATIANYLARELRYMDAGE
jgi:hypothetical protein